MRGRDRVRFRGGPRSLGRVVRAAGQETTFPREKPLTLRGHSVAWVPPLVLLVGIVVIDLTTGVFGIVAWTVLVPGIAAALSGLRTTAVFAVLSLVVYILVTSVWWHWNETEVAGFVLVLVGGLLATVACAVRLRGVRRMLHMRDIADTTGRVVLRPLPPGWGGLEHSAVYLSADVEARVGGDFYDIQPGPHGTRVLLGDVQGKGLGAVEAAAALLGTFREAAYHDQGLGEVAGRLEKRMLRHRAHTAALGRADGDRFATALLLGFPVGDAGAVEVVVFGHDPPLVLRPGAVRTPVVVGGLPLGYAALGSGLPPVCRVELAPDETLLLVTDGVTEARDPAGEFYPYVDELTRAVESDPHLQGPDRLVAFVLDGVLRHTEGRLTDDTTIFAVRRRRR
ncbi:PP2C family protein-serine/threonine phosphatase [Streptomyces sp. WMMC905]|uniref:PP2C family protein-serine/threonine phosphatase n=1 Tax=Streptomyces sp. WMMC905 TaxID=3404123 RepID=UPI003B95E4DC